LIHFFSHALFKDFFCQTLAIKFSSISELIVYLIPKVTTKYLISVNSKLIADIKSVNVQCVMMLVLLMRLNVAIKSIFFIDAVLIEADSIMRNSRHFIWFI
jgi:hypothetical protein